MDEELPCPVEVILGMVSGKWKVRIFRELSSGEPIRYSQISANIEGVSAKVLTQQLRELEDDGLIVRHVFQEIPPHVEYQLTESGLGVVKALMMLRKWGYGLNGVDMRKCDTCLTYERYEQELERALQAIEGINKNASEAEAGTEQSA